jgi:hypothetical protein
MNHEDILSIRQSYIRCIAQKDFPVTFYERFINSSPVIQEKFKDVFNIKKTVMVTRGLNALINLEEQAEADENLKALAQKHNER